MSQVSLPSSDSRDLADTEVADLLECCHRGIDFRFLLLSLTIAFALGVLVIITASRGDQRETEEDGEETGVSGLLSHVAPCPVWVGRHQAHGL